MHCCASPPASPASLYRSCASPTSSPSACSSAKASPKSTSRRRSIQADQNPGPSQTKWSSAMHEFSPDSPAQAGRGLVLGFNPRRGANCSSVVFPENSHPFVTFVTSPPYGGIRRIRYPTAACAKERRPPSGHLWPPAPSAGRCGCCRGRSRRRTRGKCRPGSGRRSRRRRCRPRRKLPRGCGSPPVHLEKRHVHATGDRHEHALGTAHGDFVEQRVGDRRFRRQHRAVLAGRSPVPIIARPMPFITVLTSAKSRFISPSLTIRSVMQLTPE